MSKHTGVYAILPADLDTQTLLEKAESALLGGVRIIQFRDKKSGFKRQLKRATQLRKLTSQHQATFIVNDSLQLALESGANGVHLGRDDVSDVSRIRQQVSSDFIVGITCRADARYAKSALEFGASYVSFGAVFPSTTKADVPVMGLPRLHKACTMFPGSEICAIGGITSEALPAIKASGATYAAVISSLFQGDKKQVQNTAANMIEIWNNAPSA